MTRLRPRRRLGIAVTLIGLLAGGAVQARDGVPADAAQAPGADGRSAFVATVCRVIEAEARTWRLPAPFFARLIWQESRFDPGAVSPKGAQGIAQFMPGTARLRGLADPFEPVAALRASARYLADLRREFGNLGLAAAAYNAGRGRVHAWRAARSGLPYETEDYVLSITGFAAADWTREDFAPAKFTLDDRTSFQNACRNLPVRPATPQTRVATAPWQPWGVHLTADWSRAKALRFYSEIARKFDKVIGGRAPMVVSHVNYSWGMRPRYYVLLGEPSRSAAENLCARLKRSGGLCMVVKN